MGLLSIKSEQDMTYLKRINYLTVVRCKIFISINFYLILKKAKICSNTF